MNDELPTLYHFRISHYNEKVGWALDFKRRPHVRKALIPGFHLARTRLMTGQNKLPALRIGARTICDSSAILAELERLWPEPPLVPRDDALRRRALALEEHFDEEVAPDLRRLFWSCYIDKDDACARMATDGSGPLVAAAWRAAFPLLRPLMRANMGLDAERVGQARARLEAHFDRLESELGGSGFLAGESFSIADLTAAAVFSAIIRPPQFPYSLPEPQPPGLVRLRERSAGRRGHQWVLDVYARHRCPSCAVLDA
jgi:glutathione S-transferase